jgi:hypothetical protein
MMARKIGAIAYVETDCIEQKPISPSVVVKIAAAISIGMHKDPAVIFAFYRFFKT